MNRLAVESQKLTFDGKRFGISTRNLQNCELIHVLVSVHRTLSLLIERTEAPMTVR